MRNLQKITDKPHPIFLGEKVLGKIYDVLNTLNLGNFPVIITSKKVYDIYGEEVCSKFHLKKTQVIILPNGEIAKSPDLLFKIISKIISLDKLSRRIYLICLGGGAVSDVGGFAAAVYKRGIPYINIPTTLLAQIDASIGGKTGIDFYNLKNIIGAFYYPEAVFLDTHFLKTLPLSLIIEGMAEVIKYAIVFDKSFFNFLLKNNTSILKLNSNYIKKTISICAKLKAEIVKKDFCEKKGLRTLLNYGHTFAHALELSLSKKISHGKAVSIGMVFAAYLSYKLGMCKYSCVEGIKKILQKYHLPTNTIFNATTIYKSICYDKKFTKGKIRMVLIKDIGKPKIVEDIPYLWFKKNIKNFLNLY